MQYEENSQNESRGGCGQNEFKKMRVDRRVTKLTTDTAIITALVNSYGSPLLTTTRTLIVS